MMSAFLSLLAMVYIGYACLLVHSVLFKIPPKKGTLSQPLLAVSILKPIGGLIPEAFLNFASFCEQEGVQFELIFGLHGPCDAMLITLKALKLAYPKVAIRWVVCDQHFCANPKVNTLLHLLPLARYPWVLISDSDMRVEERYLQNMLSKVRDSTGAVTNLYRSKVSGWVGKLEALRSAGECHMGALVAHRLTNNFLGGWSILIHKKALNSVGGLEAIKDTIGEDFALAILLKRQGWTIELALVVNTNVQVKESFWDLWARYVRWNKGILVNDPLGYWFILIQYIPLGIFWGFWMDWASPWLFSAIWLIRGGLAWWVSSSILNDRIVSQYFWLLPWSDALGFSIWFRSLWGRTFIWRGVSYRLDHSRERIIR